MDGEHSPRWHYVVLFVAYMTGKLVGFTLAFNRWDLTWWPGLMLAIALGLTSATAVDVWVLKRLRVRRSPDSVPSAAIGHEDHGSEGKLDHR